MVATTLRNDPGFLQSRSVVEASKGRNEPDQRVSYPPVRARPRSTPDRDPRPNHLCIVSVRYRQPTSHRMTMTFCSAQLTTQDSQFPNGGKP